MKPFTTVNGQHYQHYIVASTHRVTCHWKKILAGLNHPGETIRLPCLYRLAWQSLPRFRPDMRVGLIT